jgi:tetratricopeptide (TPR) repeat protein
MSYLNTNNLDRAIADFTEALKADGNNYESYNGRGLACFQKNDYDKAIADYTDAININTFFVEAWKNRAAAHSAAAKMHEELADADLRQARDIGKQLRRNEE